jgi:4-cresol dehydrogenase (hydroxylating)
MQLILPPGIGAAEFDRALKAFAGVVGEQWLLSTDSDRDAYSDVYAVPGQPQHTPSAAVAPADVEQVRALVRLANEHRIPLWPISRGKNMGYGGSAPRLSGSVVLDMSRMKRILEVDEKRGYCLIEPGVGFQDLHVYLREKRIPLWLSLPGNAWGSVLGNALERGMGLSPYGEHAEQICGLEVVLPDGDLLRTGTGAMSNSKTWQLARHGLGPSWDQLFAQSNFGIVTKMGLWLMPEPEATWQAMVQLEAPIDLQRAIDALHPLRLRNVIEHPVVFLNYLETAILFSQRDEWHKGVGALPESAGRAIRERFKIGFWSVPLNFYGHEEVVEANARIVRAALGQPIDFKKWRRGEPFEASGAGIPGTLSLQAVNWHGGRGGHIGFSPNLPPDGKLAWEQYQRAKRRYDERGMDFNTAFALTQRRIVNINMILFDRDDPKLTSDAYELFKVLVADAQREGYSEYRTHLSFMDQVARTFDFNDHALRRLNEKVKNALDPSGILAPGKQGIWPGVYRDDAVIVNALGGLSNPNYELAQEQKRSGPRKAVADLDLTAVDARALRDAHDSGLTAVNVTLGYVAGDAEPFEMTLSEIASWDAFIRAHSRDLLKVYTAADIQRAQAAGQIGVIYGFQNTAMLGQRADRVDLFAKLGVRVIQLTYNPANAAGDGSMVPENRGLTPFGREVVERLNANRIMVDLSHSGQNTCLDAIRASRQPISINHTGCRALVDLPRNKTDEELRLVASKGGFVGIYFMPFLGANSHAKASDVVAHIEHAIKVCGEDHVGIGTDGTVTGIDDLEAYKTSLAREIEARRKAGIGAKGERPDSYPFVVDLRGVHQFRELARLLEKRGHTSSRIEKILGRNFLNFAREIWGMY